MDYLEYIDPETEQTELLVAVEDIIAFYHDATGTSSNGGKGTFYIIIGREQMSWCEVTEDCYMWMAEKWSKEKTA